MPPLPKGAGEPKTEERETKRPQEPEETAETLPCLTAEQAAGLPEEQLAVLRALRTDTPRLSDELAEETGLPIQRVLPALTLLEISGWVVSGGGRSFTRCVALPEQE